MKTWTSSLHTHVKNIVNNKRASHIRRVSSYLRSLAVETDDMLAQTQDRLLGGYPGMPVKYFAACLQVSYNTGRTLYKKWHELRNLKRPRAGRTSSEGRIAWEQIVLREIGLI